VQLLRFPGAVERDPAIDAVRRRRARAASRRPSDGVRGRCGVRYVNAFTAHVNVGFFLGAHLPDPAGLLEGTGKNMRHVKLRPGTEVDRQALVALIQAAYVLVRSNRA
jgi:hypothetical protein